MNEEQLKMKHCLHVESEKMKKICKILIRKYKNSYWGTVRQQPDITITDFLCYDTELFLTEKEAIAETKSFAKWKGFKIIKIIKEIK